MALIQLSYKSFVSLLKTVDTILYFSYSLCNKSFVVDLSEFSLSLTDKLFESFISFLSFLLGDLNRLTVCIVYSSAFFIYSTCDVVTMYFVVLLAIASEILLEFSYLLQQIVIVLIDSYCLSQLKVNIYFSKSCLERCIFSINNSSIEFSDIICGTIYTLLEILIVVIRSICVVRIFSSCSIAIDCTLEESYLCSKNYIFFYIKRVDVFACLIESFLKSLDVRLHLFVSRVVVVVFLISIVCIPVLLSMLLDVWFLFCTKITTFNSTKIVVEK